VDGGAADPQNLIWVIPAEERRAVPGEAGQDEVVVVVAGGCPLRRDVASLVPSGARVLAADGGISHVHALGLRAEALIGDLDSATSKEVEEAVSRGTQVVRHPTAKDATDLELSLDAALALSPQRIVVLVDGGGRLDHLLSALLLLGSPRYAGIQLDAQVGSALVHVVRGERELAATPGEIVSLLALHGAAEGVRTEGLAYPLAGETLEPGSSRGVSNLFLEARARVSLERGVLLAVRPGTETGWEDEPK
jgi:thiamine pyrophosphokinase